MNFLPPDLSQKSASFVQNHQHNKPTVDPVTKPTPCKTYVVTPQVAGQTTRKSYTQVARWVSPPSGVTNACGLKPEGYGNRPIKRKRRNPLTVRLSDSERDVIRTRAKESGISLNAYVRSSLLNHDAKPSKAQAEAIRALNLELTRQGSNLNQIAKHLNSSIGAQADTNSMLGVMARAYLQSHKAVRDAMLQGNKYAAPDGTPVRVAMAAKTIAAPIPNNTETYKHSTKE